MLSRAFPAWRFLPALPLPAPACIQLREIVRGASQAPLPSRCALSGALFGIRNPGRAEQGVSFEKIKFKVVFRGLSTAIETSRLLPALPKRSFAGRRPSRPSRRCHGNKKGRDRDGPAPKGIRYTCDKRHVQRRCVFSPRRVASPICAPVRSSRRVRSARGSRACCRALRSAHRSVPRFASSGKCRRRSGPFAASDQRR
jgi:hypothetical protein